MNVLVLRFRKRTLAVALLTLLFCAGWAFPALAQAWLERVSGEAWVVGTTGGRRPALARMTVQSGERLVTGEAGTIVVLLADASRVTVRPRTVMRVERTRAASSAISLPAGEVSVVSSAYRWKGEALNVSTPIATIGVRGTEFEVSVAPSGEAWVYVETGAVIAPTVEVAAGRGAALSFGGTPQAEAVSDPQAARLAWQRERRERLAGNRELVAEAIGALLRTSFGQWRTQVDNFFSTFREIGAALKQAGDEPERANLDKLARAVIALKSGVERARAVLVGDRELKLREETLRNLVNAGELPPLAALAARNTLNQADRDRVRRERDLVNLDQALDNLGGSLAVIAAVAAADPGADRAATRIITEGLGFPLQSEPVTDTRLVIGPGDIAWQRGRQWDVLRTVRGRADWRVPLTVTVVPDTLGYTVTYTPLAFDTPASFQVIPTDTATYLTSFAAVAGVTLQRPALLYQFPIELGDTWMVWTPPSFFPPTLWIERQVTAQERITTAAGTFDCLRVETRLRQKRRRSAPLIHAEWLAPGIGAVREITFRGDNQSIQWDERL